MLISDVTLGQEFTIFVRSPQKTLTFQSRVTEINEHKHYIITDAVIHDDKPISFRAKNVLVEFLFTDDKEDKPMLFKNVTCQLLKDGMGKYYYRATCLTPGVPHNRRESFRCYVGISSSLQCNINTQAYPVMIKDVSSSGFAIVCENNIDLSTGQLVHTVLNDQPQANGTCYNFHLYGFVARRQELENGKLLYGCRLNSPIAGLDKYIMEKERIRLKSTNGGNL